MMSELHLTDEILMAFADGELEETMVAAVALAMAQDPVVARKIVDFQQSRRLTRSAYASSLASDVPLELQAAISAQIKAYEGTGKGAKELAPHEPRSARLGRSYPFMKMAVAASFAAIAAATGYFIGRHEQPEAGQIAQLEAPLIRQELNRLGSGREVKLPIGRLRVISTYKLADGTLCREFRLQSVSGAADAVACQAGEWNVTFALANPTGSAEYMPSSGSDLMGTYLQNLGAGRALEGEVEAKALAEAAR
jgi:hypothetical protein